MFHNVTGESSERKTIADMSFEWIWERYGGMIERIARQPVSLGEILPRDLKRQLREETFSDGAILRAIERYP